jgi:CBS domain-containing protein
VVGGLIVGLMARHGSEKIRGHGIPEAIEAILFGKSRLSPKVAVLKPLSSGIVIGSGGPFGAEGPIIMTGGAADSLLSQLIRCSRCTPPARWPALASCVVAGLLAGLVGWLEPRALGVGYDVIADLLNHRLLVDAALALLAAKAVMWILALGSGTSGGVLAPLLMIGAGLGTVLAPVVLLMRRSILTEKIARRGRHIYREYGVDPQERTHVDEVMTRNVDTIPADTPLAEACERWFGAAQRHRAFPVLDAAGAVLGVLDRERLAEAMRGAQAPACVGALFAGHASRLALPGETCSAVARRMVHEGAERLPVVADLRSKRLVGLVSRSDLIEPVRAVHEEESRRERLIRLGRR